MEKTVYNAYVAILKNELIPSLGCTEPIALAYAAAKARAILGTMPEKLELKVSGNMVKNVQGVTVPNSGGLRGVRVAAVLGTVGGNAEKELEVLSSVTADDIALCKKLVDSGFCTYSIAPGVENLYIYVKATAGGHYSEVELKNSHTNITKLALDGKCTVLKECADEKMADLSLLNIKDIIEFANTINIEDVREVLDRQIEYNTAIANEGLEKALGAGVGRTLIDTYGNDVKIRARAKAAAGSDARMSGCAMPVVINSGSGNQGITVSLPVIEFANELKVSREKLYRALVISNLTALHQKKYIGRLSAYCGAVSAACGSGAAITYLYGGGYDDISATITNTIANVGGIVCDGAKPSCAAKIASSVDAAIMAHFMGQNKRTFHSGEGIVKDDVEHTIQSVGRVGREGMRTTDEEILKIMTEN